VANPRAQGQAITRTDTAAVTACSTAAPESVHSAKVTAATETTTGTNTAATRSTRRWIGALPPCAAATRATMRESVVSAPIRVASTRIRPEPLIAPAVTASPLPFVTGRLSPVIRESSVSVSPSTTTPSTGMRSPGLTSATSPTRTRAIGRIVPTPKRSIRALSGLRAIRARIAAVAPRFARSSSHLPNRTRVMIRAEASKYRCGGCPAGAVSSSARLNR
jgi:hypothetical protein